MDQNNDQNIENNQDSNATNGRRKFLRKASVGALIATIPAKSVWATGLTNSVVASGHGSDMAGGQSLRLLEYTDFSNNISLLSDSVLSQSFSQTFGVPALKQNGQARANDVTLGQILTTKNPNGRYKYRGISNYNLLMVSTYLNAVYDGLHGISFPVIGYQKSFSDRVQFGLALGRMAGSNPAVFAGELRMLADNPTALAMRL